MRFFPAARTILFVFVLQMIWCKLIFFFFSDVLSLWASREAAELLFFGCIFAPIWEEFVFRHAPIQLGVKYFPKMLPTIIVFAAIIFGYQHGGVPNILVQGVFGLLFSYTYMKHGLLASIIQHSLWNFHCYFEIFKLS